MKRVLFINNIPAPYRIDFFNELGKYVDLTVLFEAKTTPFTVFNYNLEDVRTFRAIFLREGNIRERRVDWSILRYLKRGAYDTVIVTNYAYFTEAVAILALKMRGIPYEMELDGGVNRKENPLLHALKRLLVGGAARYWSTGKRTDVFFAAFGVSKEKIVRYPFTSVLARDVVDAVPTAEERRSLRKLLGVPYQKMVLGVGKPTHRKGFDLLLRAAATFSPDTGVYIIGGNPPQEWLDIVRQNDLKNVTFIPFCAHDTLRDYYRAADVFALPTREDVWGLVINEAMANGVPVVTTDGCVAGCEMIRNGENGYRIPVDDWEALARSVNRLLHDEEHRLSVAAEGLSTVRGYTIEAMARAHAELLSCDL